MVSLDLTPFSNRLRKNHRHWGKWARRREISCYRIYDRDIPEFPLVIDWYQGQVHAQTFIRDDQEIAEEEIAPVLCKILEIPRQNLAFKSRQQQKGSTQYERLRKHRKPFVVHEAGLAFEVELHSYLDTGLFLDHRNTRAMVRDMSQERRILNLFAYTSSFSVYAAAGGAEGTVSVDLSNSYQEWSQRNFELNSMDLKKHQLVREDVFKYLYLAQKNRERFDLIILDPPSFSNSKRMRDTLDVQRDHPKLLEGCVQLLNPGGKIIFSNNRRKFRIDPAIGEHSEEITHKTIPDDFKRHTAHRCWLFQA
jgi:23S rRNA (cytosine1962-C5)-methyltransferase